MLTRETRLLSVGANLKKQDNNSYSTYKPVLPIVSHPDDIEYHGDGDEATELGNRALTRQRQHGLDNSAHQLQRFRSLLAILRVRPK